MTVHYRNGDRFVCGAVGREGGGSVSQTSSEHKLAVTCEECQATPVWKNAGVRLVLAQGGPYIHG